MKLCNLGFYFLFPLIRFVVLWNTQLFSDANIFGYDADVAVVLKHSIQMLTTNYCNVVKL